jgi:hypothetical protein
MGQPPRDTQLYWPADVSFSQSGTPLVVDWNNHRIIAPDASGNFKLLAGGVFGDPCLSAPAACQDIVAAGSELNQPTDVAFDADGNIALPRGTTPSSFSSTRTTG